MVSYGFKLADRWGMREWAACHPLVARPLWIKAVAEVLVVHACGVGRGTVLWQVPIAIPPAAVP